MSKITIRIERRLLERLDSSIERGRFPNRNTAIADALRAMLRRLSRHRLRDECARLDRKSEGALADPGLSADLVEWPEY